jgi:hypothetical protein
MAARWPALSADQKRQLERLAKWELAPEGCASLYDRLART